MVNKRLVAALNRRTEAIQRVIAKKPQGINIDAMNARHSECISILKSIEENDFDAL